VISSDEVGEALKAKVSTETLKDEINKFKI